jgi:hypothetical protein
MKFIGLAIAMAGVILSLAAVSPAASVGEKLPDLAPLPKYLKDRRVETSGGQTFLRFSNGVGNYGDGPVEVRGERSSTSDPMIAIQRIYLTGGGFTEATIGTFTYHPTHGHWHFDYFAKYELVDSSGDAVAFNEKAGFCLLDVERIKPPLSGASNQPVYTSCNQGDTSALSIGPHGISRGWTDIYRKYLPDQSINITGVPAGSYTLRVTADPLDKIDEANEGNNVTSVPVTIR